MKLLFFPLNVAIAGGVGFCVLNLRIGPTSNLIDEPWCEGFCTIFWCLMTCFCGTATSSNVLFIVGRGGEATSSKQVWNKQLTVWKLGTAPIKPPVYCSTIKLDGFHRNSPGSAMLPTWLLYEMFPETAGPLLKDVDCLAVYFFFYCNVSRFKQHVFVSCQLRQCNIVSLRGRWRSGQKNYFIYCNNHEKTSSETMII